LNELPAGHARETALALVRELEATDADTADVG
jgi:hypothetical protein